jgi:hypothetical protein
MRRRLAILLLALLGWLLGGVLLTPSPAGAIGLDCKESPTPEVPGRGLTGFFQSEPRQLPPQEDPFAPNSRTTIYEQYGYAGLRWTTYDLGCGPDSARAPDATAGTAVANWLFLIPKAGVAFTNAVVEVALRPRFLSEFDPLVSQVSNVLYRTLFSNWVPIALIATGALLIWRARRANLASSAAAVGWAAVIMIVATALFQWPVQAGRAADTSVTSTLTAVSSQLARNTGTAQTATEKTAASNTHEALLYQAWLAGTFGESDSSTARLYGPQLFDATALTWREARTLQQDPAQGKTIIEGKQRKFADVAARIKNADPDAYEYLTGKRSETRVGYALIATFGALCALPFLLGAFLLVLAAFLVVRLAVMLFPAFAVLAVFPSMRRVATGAGSIVVAALLNAVIFGVAAIAVLRAIGILLDPSSPLPRWLSLTLMLLITIVMWVILRPVRRLGSMLLSGHARLAGPAEAPVPLTAGGQPQGRHRMGEDRASEEAPSSSSAESRSEVHTVAESEPSAGLPAGYTTTTVPRSPEGPTVTQSTRQRGGNDPGAGRPAAYSPNGTSPVASEANSLEEPATDQTARGPASRESPQTAVDGRWRVSQPMRRPLGSDGANVPLTVRSTTEETTGPIYVPGPATVSNGRTAEAGAVRTDEEVMSQVYRPSGKGRAPTRSGE